MAYAAASRADLKKLRWLPRRPMRDGGHSAAVRLLAACACAISGMLSFCALAAPCEHEEFVTKVTGEHECLVMRRYGMVAAESPGPMLVWLHGDVSSGGPAEYHFRVAEKASRDFADANVLSIALVRPGYGDADGNVSGGNNYGRSDQYTAENIAEVGAAISHLREKYKPSRVIVIGHSGGAATAAVLLGMRPGLADGTVLVSCPCDLGAWRMGRRGWTRSEDPMRWASKARPPTKVIALTGNRDDNTLPDLAKRFVGALKVQGIDAKFEEIDGASHNGAFTSPDVFRAVGALLKP